MISQPRLCAGPVKRREFLAAGMLGLGGLSLPELFRLRAIAAEANTPVDAEKAVIFVWLPGGPPHLDMYDMKPDAPTDYRGPFRPIATSVPGIDVCELMPRHAKIAAQFSIVRSVAHTFSGHDGGHKRFMTGRIPASPTGFVNDAPATGSIVAKCLEDKDHGIPNYVSLNPKNRGGDSYSQGTAYLGNAFAPFLVDGDPSAPNFVIPNLVLQKNVAQRIGDRKALLSSLDRLQRQTDMMESIDTYQRKAFSLLMTDKARRAFDLSEEPGDVRDRYGRHSWGQRALMARRLVEAGISFVTLIMENPFESGPPRPPAATTNWDSHAVNCHIWDDLKIRLPMYDQALSALIEDISERGLDKKTMILATGEFGRTPRIGSGVGTTTRVMQPGRDHWPQAMSLVMAGGGLKTGRVVGATNSRGEYPTENPLTPNDVWATVYRHLGIDPSRAFPDHRGRPMPILPFGEPIGDLL